MPSRGRPAYIGVDTGGTFTDFVCLCGRELSVLKLPSTPHDPAQAVLDGLRRVAPKGSIVVRYGSTVATNALLERRGARVVLITTAGFEDLLEIGRQDRPVLYTLSPDKPKPLVPRDRRLGAPERMLYDGRVGQRLSPRAVERLVRRAVGLGAEAVAVCLLHSYVNPAHERSIARALAAVAIPVSVSHRLVHEYREYERLSTTVINAYVAPVVATHLRSLERKISGPLRVMQSSGGIAEAEVARREPVRTILSGPAGGVIGAAAIAKRVGVRRIMTLDMGGTSTDVCLVDSAPTRRTDATIGGLPVKLPTVDIHTVGAGGGSIARLDSGGSLKVGPESAGADPGPACYGRAMTPTVTDANLVLGRLLPGEFLGGTLPIDEGRARRAIGRLARQAGLSTLAAAEGVVRIVNASMERALRVISVERGFDARSFTLVAFGGAAGLHACELAEALDVSRVLVPREPGLISAWGMLVADTVKDYATSVMRTGMRRSDFSALYRKLAERAEREMRRAGVDMKRLTLVRSLDLRYQGQSCEIEVPFGPAYSAAFNRAHERLYGSADPTRPVEVVTLRLKAVAPAEIRVPTANRAVRIADARTRSNEGPDGGRSDSAHPLRQEPRRVRLYWRGRRWSATVVGRADGGVGRRCPGPAVICEFSATTYIPPGWVARTDGMENLVITRSPRTGHRASSHASRAAQRRQARRRAGSAAPATQYLKRRP